MEQTLDKWAPWSRDKVYEELDHPADLFLKIMGSAPSHLLENALFALYDQMVSLAGFEARREITIRVRETGLAEALRALLGEALYRFAVEGFVAVGAEVDVHEAVPAGHGDAGPGPREPQGEVQVTARLWGDDADRLRHTLLTEIKAVTFHRLAATREPDGTWQATVLLDI